MWNLFERRFDASQMHSTKKEEWGVRREENSHPVAFPGEQRGASVPVQGRAGGCWSRRHWS